MSKISIIIPVYKVEAFLGACLDSVLAQTYGDWEAICINDGSPDNCPKILEEYAQKESRIHVIHQENQGVAAARNRGLEVATGKYLAFLDSDDMLHPQFLELMIEAIQKTKVPMVWCAYEKVPETAKVPTDKDKKQPQEIKIYPDILSAYLQEKISSLSVISNKLYLAEPIKNLRFQAGLSVFEDMAYLIKALYLEEQAAFVPEKLLLYRMRAESITHTAFSEKKADDHLAGVQDLTAFFETKEMPEKTKAQLNKKLAKLCLKFCALVPYRQDKENCLRYWQKYASVLALLQEQGIYRPSALNARNRLKSYLFTRKHFNLLKLIIKL